MSDETTTVGGYPRGLRLSNAQDETLRHWPLERIKPKAVALGVRFLFAEVDSLRERVVALEGALLLADEVARLTKWGITVTDCREGCEHPACLILRSIAKYQKARAALTQADEAGGGAG